MMTTLATTMQNAGRFLEVSKRTHSLPPRLTERSSTLSTLQAMIPSRPTITTCILLTACLTTPCFAKVTNLTCKEIKGKTETTNDTYGFISRKRDQKSEVEDLKEFWSIPVNIDAQAGIGSFFAKQAGIEVGPDSIVLRQSDGTNPASRSSSSITINRKDLSFKYASFRSVHSEVPGVMSAHNVYTRNSSGICSRVSTKGSKI